METLEQRCAECHTVVVCPYCTLCDASGEEVDRLRRELSQAEFRDLFLDIFQRMAISEEQRAALSAEVERLTA